MLVVEVPCGVVSVSLALVKPAGTSTETLASELTVKAAATEPNATLVVSVKPDPLTVTLSPTKPWFELSDAIFGKTRKGVALLVLPSGALTVIGPDVQPVGTTAVSRVALANVTLVEGVPLKLTVAPFTKPVPLTVTTVPCTALAGEKLEIVGAAANPCPTCSTCSTSASPAGAPPQPSTTKVTNNHAFCPNCFSPNICRLTTTTAGRTKALAKPGSAAHQDDASQGVEDAEGSRQYGQTAPALHERVESVEQLQQTISDDRQPERLPPVRYA